jgi:hypothetical protein
VAWEWWELVAAMLALFPGLTPDQAWAMRITEATNLIDARERLMNRLATAAGKPADDAPQTETRPDGSTVHRFRGEDGLRKVYELFAAAQPETVSRGS